MLWDVLEEHLDEAGFLWGRWERALDSSKYTLDEVCNFEEPRLLAHLDALAVGGPEVAERLLYPALESGDRLRTSAAAYALLESPGTLPRILDFLEHARSPASREGIGRALELRPRDEVGPALATFASKSTLHPPVLARALDVLAFLRHDPGGAFKAAYDDSIPEVRAAAIRAANCPAGQRYRGAVERALADPDDAVRLAAIETGLVMGLPGAWDRCVESAASDAAALAHPALAWTALLGGEGDLPVVLSALSRPEHAHAALWAAGFSGWKVAAEACLPWIADPKLGRLAGEAFAAITGVDPEELELDEGDELDAENSGEEEDEVPVPWAESELPLLGSMEAQSYWASESDRFDARARYLAGRPWAEQLTASIATGTTRRRHLLAFAVAARTRGKIWIPTRAWGEVQRKRTGDLAADEPSARGGRET